MRQRMMLQARLMTQNDRQVVSFHKMYTLTVCYIVTTDVINELDLSLCFGKNCLNFFVHVNYN